MNESVVIRIPFYTYYPDEDYSVSGYRVIKIFNVSNPSETIGTLTEHVEGHEPTVYNLVVGGGD